MTKDVRTSLKTGAASTGEAAVLIALSRIAPGGFAEAEANIDGDAESIILYRDGDDVRAWRNICPHAGRRLDWAPGQFLKTADGLMVCAAHGASFELQHGECVAGPCRGQHLSAIAVQVRDGEIVLASEPTVS